ncbi:MAG: histidine kinase [Bacteroidales bacterium]|nr:histidine kinase [Bacteroidales bacterium]
MSYKTYIIIIGFLAISLTVFSQSPTFRHYTVNDGLPSSEVFHVIQDSKGYIWFATNMGVSRFNGYEFENFDIQDGLPDNTVFEIYEDFKGRIWFIPFSCRLSYYYNDSIYQFPYNEKLIKCIKKPKPVKLSFYVDTLETVYFGIYAEGIIKITHKGMIERLFYDISEWVNIYIVDDIKPLISSTNSTFIKQSLSVFDNILNIKNKYNLENHPWIYPLIAIMNQKSELIFSNDKIIHKINSENHIISKKYNEVIIWLSYDRNMNLWLGSLKGGVLYYKNGNFFSDYCKHYLINKSVSSVLEDNEGGFWFSTLQNGVYYLPSLNFQTYTKNDGLPNNQVNSIAIGNDKRIWIGTNDSYVSLIKDSSIKIYKLSKDPSEVVSTLLLNNCNNLVVGTNRYSYLIKNTKILKIKNNHPITVKKNNMPGPLRTISILQDKTGNYLIGGTFGFTKICGNNVIYSSFYDDKFMNRVNSIFEKEDGSLLLGCLNGLWKYENKKYYYLGDTNKILKTRILDIKKCDYDNKIWLGSKGAGILIIDNDTIYQITKKDGLTSNSITSLFIDKNIVWAATNNGLNKIKLKNSKNLDYKIETYTTINGLASNEIKQVIVRDSNVYLASNEGLTVFDFTKVHPNNVPPPIYITKFKIMDKDTLLKSYYELPFHQNFISIDFVGLAYKNAGNLTYKYKLEGAGNNWVKTKNTQVQYPSLSPDKYTFLVIAQNEDGVWSEKPASVSFIINPHFWKTWWFILLSFTLIFIIVIFLYTVRIRNIKKRNELKGELIKIRQQALSSQMNPHFIFNSLNSIQNFIIENDKLSSNLYLSKFASLMRKVLNNSQKQTISLQEEIEALTLYIELEAMRFKDKFQFIINVDKNLNIELINIPPLILQPYVENAIWHGLMHKDCNGLLKIDFVLENNYVICCIEDDGIGREKAMEIKKKKQQTYKSLGTNITKKRLDLFNLLHQSEMQVVFHDLKDKNGNAIGTKVEIIFSVH